MRVSAESDVRISVTDALPEERLDVAVNRLCYVVTGSGEKEFGFNKSWQWYCRHLESCAAALWNDLIVLVVAGIPHLSDLTSVEARIKLYTVLAVVAESLINEEEPSLSTIVVDLNTQKLLNEDNDEFAAQLVFQIIGWLSGLWDALPDPSSDSLRLNHVNTGRKTRRRICRPDTTLSISEASYQRLHHVARRFEDLLPTPHISHDDAIYSSRDEERAVITNAYLAFHSLEDLVSVRLAWTGTINQHLQYDSRSKTLCVFKYPSICLLMCKEDGHTLLSRLFDCERKELFETSQQDFLRGISFDTFLLELLQSYKLIFGANPKSRKRAAYHIASLRSQNDVDPLLELLCTAKDDSQELADVFSELELEHYDNYVPVSEFPFFAKRLLSLQIISMYHTPSSLRRLWNDRRNPGTWFALWAVLIIGFGTLILQALQLVFQIYQPFG